MIIAHLPAGYVLARLLVRSAESCGVPGATFLWAGVLGAITPDLDMFYFYLVDHRQHHHHTYCTHFPILWLTLLVASVIWFRLAKTKTHAACAAIFSLNGVVHMFLDTVVGDIWWFAPWINKPFALFTIPALYTPWWLNFLVHWSFAFELAILCWAIVLWCKPRCPVGGAATDKKFTVPQNTTP